MVAVAGYDVRYVASPNFDARPPETRPDMVVLHYTDMPSADAALARLCAPASKVSAHYVIGRAGEIYQLVADDKRAWHAGVSYWQGEENLNACSLGIELDNDGHEAYPSVQMRALTALLTALTDAFAVPQGRIVGHSDIAPGRKADPGAAFDWAALALAGFGLWPAAARAAKINADLFWRDLAAIGYRPPQDEADRAAIIRAFQLHFRQSDVGGALDAETCGLARAVAAMCA